VVFAFFYNFDFGAAVLIAYLGTIFTRAAAMILKKETIKKLLNETGKFFLPLELVFIIATILITGLSYLRSGSFPNWSTYLYIIFSQTGKLFNTYLLAVDYYYLPLAIYIVCYYYIFHCFFRKKTTPRPELVFLLIYGLIIFSYYINLSEPNHLWTVIHPALLIFFILVSRFFESMKQEKQKKSLIQIFLPTLFFVAGFFAIFHSPVFFLKNALAKFQYRYSANGTGFYYWGYRGTDFYLQDNSGEDFQLAAAKINRLVKDRSVVIISRYSPLLYLMSGKTSLIDHPNPECDFYTADDFNQAVDRIRQIKPAYIFVYSEKYNQYYLASVNLMRMFWERVKNDYSFQETAGAVDVYKLKILYD